jgi:tetratricopeptide (TPR) repeat protein
MSSTTASSKPDTTMASSRAALRESVIFPLAEETDGHIAELVSIRQGDCHIERFDSVDAYKAYFHTIDEASFPGEGAANAAATMVVWLFGPEREASPTEIYRALSDAVMPGGQIVVASEAPWPGKILASDEWGEYTNEETAAALIRAGFYDIDAIVEGPFFRLIRAKRRTDNVHRAFMDAERFLDQGDHASAEAALNSVTEQMDSALLVREYALLVAACHDLAGRPEHALEALSEALTLDPRCARAMCGIGRIAALKGDLTSAAEFFQSALRCEPALVAALHGMAIIQEAGGDLRSAYRSMVTASDLRPRNDALLSEAARLGNAIGKINDVARFIAHRLGKSTEIAVIANEATGPASSASVQN